MSKAKLKELFSVQKILALIALVLLVVVGLSGPLAAQLPSVTQGYGTDSHLQKGMIIRLKEGDASKVTPLASQEIDHMHGVIVDANDAPLTVSGKGEKVFVATGGRYSVLVSSQNGYISQGDYVTISAIHGIGMKAGDREPLVIGKAAGDFNEKTPRVSTTAIKDTAGGEREVVIGRVEVDIDVSRNPLLKGTEPNLPEFLQEATEAIAGKQVEPTRVYIGLVVLLVTTAISSSLLYGGVRSGIISMGRNPLSKKLIIRGMVQVIISGLIIFIVGLFAVYLLLKL